MHRVGITCWLVLLLPTALWADAQARARFIAPFLEEQTLLIVRVDFTRINVSEAARKLKPFFTSFEKEAAQAQQAAENWMQAFREAGGTELYYRLSFTDYPHRMDCLILPLSDGVDGEQLNKLRQLLGAQQSRTMHQALVLGNHNMLDRLAQERATPRPEAASAFAAAGDGAVQVFLLPPPHAKRIVEENMPTLPKEWGGDSTQVLTEGVRWAVFNADLSPEVKLTITIQAQDAAAAARMKEWLARVVQNMAQWKEVKALVPQFAQFASTLVPELHDARLILRLEVPRLAKLWAEAVPHFRKQADSQFGMNNLKQLGIAVHNYHGDYDRLPHHAIYSKDGKPLLSWRVTLLPYIEQDQLYKQFKLDEPWDSEHNKKLIPLMPKMFVVPNAPAAPGNTYYQIVVTPADYKGKYATVFVVQPPSQETRRTLGQWAIKDGTSNTIMILEAGTAVPWTKPADVELPPDDKPFPTFGGNPQEQMFPAVFADGSVRMLRRTLKDVRLHQQLLRQVIGYDDRAADDVTPLIEREDVTEKPQEKIRP